jgi:hypothetical protein
MRRNNSQGGRETAQGVMLGATALVALLKQRINRVGSTRVHVGKSSWIELSSRLTRYMLPGHMITIVNNSMTAEGMRSECSDCVDG